MKAVVSLSGGMDSATVLAQAIGFGRECTAVMFDYGSKHNQYELAAAKRVCAHYGVNWRLLDLCGVMEGFRSNLMLGGGAIPEGHYQDSTMSLTVVPSRNIIFASILSGLAWSIDAGEVWLGIHAGDHAIYPDCRPEFFAAMDHAVRLGTDNRACLQAPFLHCDKAQILCRGLELGVPYHLTRTCYKDQQLPCGKCGACQERLEAFRLQGVVDPVEYAQ